MPAWPVPALFQPLEEGAEVGGHHAAADEDDVGVGGVGGHDRQVLQKVTEETEDHSKRRAKVLGLRHG
jgi:hypothetical protein